MAETEIDPRLDRLLKRLEPEVRRAFLDAISKAKSAVNQADLVRAIERFLVTGDFDPIIAVLRLNEDTLFPLTEAVRAAYIAAGQSVGEAMTIKVQAQFGFGGNPRAVAAVQRITGDLIEAVTREHIETTRQVVARAVSEGIPPAKLARQITGTKVGNRREGGYLGLSSDLVDPIIRGRAKLLSGEPALMKEYLRLELRDKRNDKAIESAIREGRRLTSSQVDKIIDAHKAKALGYRGRRIARTETLNALRAGQHDGFGVLVDQGFDVTVTWKAATDTRTRDSHLALNGQTVDYGAVFRTITEALLEYPGDTSHGAGGEEIIQCRCAAIYRTQRRRRP